jgi:hypothetical protein
MRTGRTADGRDNWKLGQEDIGKTTKKTKAPFADFSQEG